MIKKVVPKSICWCCIYVEYMPTLNESIYSFFVKCKDIFPIRTKIQRKGLSNLHSCVGYANVNSIRMKK